MKKILCSLMMMLGLLLPAEVQAANANCSAPNVLIVFDMSGSLGGDREGTMYRQAVEAVKYITGISDSRIRYGLLSFPSPKANSTAKVYCTVDAYEAFLNDVAVDSTLNVPLDGKSGAEKYQQITDFFASCGGPRNDYDTPMYQALKATMGVSALKDPDHRNYVILITDGIQDCCHGGDYNSTADCNAGTTFGDKDYYNQDELVANRTDLIDVVTELKSNGITTFVVGFGKQDNLDIAALNGMARAGGTAIANCTDECYYSSPTKDLLQSALGRITEIASEEVCDGLDNDCNGEIDENLVEDCQAYCGTVLKLGKKVCSFGTWGECQIESSQEVCNGLDDDCDGEIDNGLIRSCSNSCGTVGTETCVNGSWQECVVPEVEEICDGIDNNCDGVIDENCACSPGETQSCGIDRGRCKLGVQTCGSDYKWGPCEGAIGPVAEICDGVVDDDCDGLTDEDCKCTNGQTAPCGESAVGICKYGVQTCNNGAWGECEGAVWPEQTELCDGVDNDCDGIVDEYCDCVNDTEIACGSNAGECKKGTQVCQDGYWSSCKNSVGPNIEICDNKDNDCDGQTDNNAICQEGTSCRCGICVSACVNGSCPRGGECIDGFCAMDSCGKGFFCDGHHCQPKTDDDVVEEAPASVPDSGCSCQDSGSPLNAFWLLFALGGLLAMTRRSRG